MITPVHLSKQTASYSAPCRGGSSGVWKGWGRWGWTSTSYFNVAGTWEHQEERAREGGGGWYLPVCSSATMLSLASKNSWILGRTPGTITVSRERTLCVGRGWGWGCGWWGWWRWSNLLLCSAPCSWAGWCSRAQPRPRRSSGTAARASSPPRAPPRHPPAHATWATRGCFWRSRSAGAARGSSCATRLRPARLPLIRSAPWWASSLSCLGSGDHLTQIRRETTKVQRCKQPLLLLLLSHITGALGCMHTYWWLARLAIGCIGLRCVGYFRFVGCCFFVCFVHLTNCASYVIRFQRKR